MISKTSRHALKALTVLAELDEGAYAGSSSIAKEIGAPPNYLGKLLQSLSHNGIVYSQKGLGGGFCLARSADKISLYDVIDLIERLSAWPECIMGRIRCSKDSPCAVHERWKEVRDSYTLFLRETTIADLIEGAIHVTDDNSHE